MESTITFRNADGTSDVWRCHELRLEDLLERERSSALGEAYLFWSDFVHPSAAFDFAAGSDSRDCPMEPSRPNPSLTSVFRVDCSSRNPFDFRIGVPVRPDQSVPLRKVAPDHVRRILAQDLNYAKACRKPLYQHVYQQFDDVTQECYRLLLPILGRTKDVAEIYGFCRPWSAERPVAAADAQEQKSTQER